MSALARIGNHKQKNPFRVTVLGQSAVGKTGKWNLCFAQLFLDIVFRKSEGKVQILC